MSKIVVEHLEYRYPTSQQLALDDLSFEVESGEMLGVIGRNSAGKSTLCQALVGLVPHFYQGAYGGKVWVDGLEVRKVPVAELSLKVGIVFQNPFTQMTGSKLTVYEEIAFGLENLGIERNEMKRRIEHVLELFSIQSVRDQNPMNLSGGQVQRVAIASMVAMQPEVMVFDEPTSQLDPKGSEEVFQAIQQLSEQGTTVVFVEHKMEKIAQYCDKVLLLDQGKRVAFGTPESVFSRPDLSEYGVTAPVYTQVCQRLKKRKKGSLVYPVTLEEASDVLGRSNHHD